MPALNQELRLFCLIARSVKTIYPMESRKFLAPCRWRVRARKHKLEKDSCTSLWYRILAQLPSAPVLLLVVPLPFWKLRKGFLAHSKPVEEICPLPLRPRSRIPFTDSSGKPQRLELIISQVSLALRGHDVLLLHRFCSSTVLQWGGRLYLGKGVRDARL